MSRAGDKLAHALAVFDVSPAKRVCADLGCSTGGFVDCLLKAGAAKVYAVDRGYGVIDYRLRRDERVVVMERTDALQVRLPEPVHLVTIDAGWTRQGRILPAARHLLNDVGEIVTLIKPQYEADPNDLVSGIVPVERVPAVLAVVRKSLVRLGFQLLAETESPILGRGGNHEFLWHLKNLHHEELPFR